MIYRKTSWVLVSIFLNPYLGKTSNLTNIFQRVWHHQLARGDVCFNFLRKKQQPRILRDWKNQQPLPMTFHSKFSKGDALLGSSGSCLRIRIKVPYAGGTSDIWPSMWKGYEKKKRVDELANLAWVFSIGFVFINRSSFFLKHLEEAHSLASQKGGQKNPAVSQFSRFWATFFFCSPEIRSGVVRCRCDQPMGRRVKGQAGCGSWKETVVVHGCFFYSLHLSLDIWNVKICIRATVRSLSHFSHENGQTKQCECKDLTTFPWIYNLYNLDFKVSPEFIRFLPLVLLMVQKSPSQPPGMVQKPCKEWNKLPTSTGERRISEPPTVSTRNCHGSGSGDPQRWWHWLRARLWLKSLGFRNRCVFLNKSIFGRHLVLRRHLFLANICIHQGKLIDKTDAELSHFSCWLHIRLFKQWIFFAPSRRLAFETTHLRNSLVGDLDHDATSHLRMAWSIGLHLRKQTYKDVQILLEAESTTMPKIFGVCCNKGNKGRVETRLVDAFKNTFLGTITYPFLTTLVESMIFRLLPFGGTSRLSVPWKLFLNARLRGNTVIRVIDSGSNPANQETGVVSRPQGITLCVWLMKESANLIPAFSCSLVAGGTPHKLGHRIM